MNDDYSEAGLAEMRRMYEDEGAAEVLAAMMHDLPMQRAQLERCAQVRDVAGFRRAAHSLKSAARMVGSGDLGSVWERIERLSTPDTLDDAVALVEAAMRRQERLMERLQRELAL